MPVPHWFTGWKPVPRAPLPVACPAPPYLGPVEPNGIGRNDHDSARDVGELQILQEEFAEADVPGARFMLKSEKHHTRMCARRVKARIGKTLIRGKQAAMLPLHLRPQLLVRPAAPALLVDGFHVMTRGATSTGRSSSTLIAMGMR